MNLHVVLAIRVGRAASFAAATTTRAPPDLRTETCYLRVVQRTPRTRRCLPRHPCRRMRRGLLRSCATGSAATLVVPGVPKTRLLRISPEVRGTSIHAKMPVEAGCGCDTVMELLLTRLGVRASHVPRTFHRRLHRQKRWHERSCSWIFLPRRRSLKNGELLFRTSSASLMVAGRSRRSLRDGDPPSRTVPVTKRLGVGRLRCILLHDANSGR